MPSWADPVDLRRLLRARDLIDRAYAQPLTVPAVARAVACSPDHFARGFRQAFGQTPHRYLTGRRIERASALLRDTDRSVTEICVAVGFTSLGSFSARFRELTGESPSGYRRRWRSDQSTVDARAGRIPPCVLSVWSRPANRAVFEKPAGAVRG